MKKIFVKFSFAIALASPIVATVACSPFLELNRSSKNEHWKSIASSQDLKSFLKDNGVNLANSSQIDTIFREVKGVGGFSYNSFLANPDPSTKILSLLVKGDSEVIWTDAPKASKYKEITSKLNMDGLPEMLQNMWTTNIYNFSKDEYHNAKSIITFIQYVVPGNSEPTYKYMVNDIAKIGDFTDLDEKCLDTDSKSSAWKNTDSLCENYDVEIGEAKKNNAAIAIAIEPKISGTLSVKSWA